MSENRESPAVGAPVEEVEASRTEVLEAVERAKGEGSEGVIGGAMTAADGGADGVADGVADGAKPETADVAKPETADAVGDTQVEAAIADEADQKRREEIAKVDTEMDIRMPNAKTEKAPRIAETEVMPSAAAETVEAPPKFEDTPVRDGEIRISADHPMAALYTQTPTPPDIRGNRGAGTLIALVATIGFAVVSAGVIALWLAPTYPPSTFISKGLLPQVMSVGFAAAAAGFLISMIALVLIVGRAGWWAYVLGGFFVAASVWASAVVGSALHDRFVLGESVSWDPIALMSDYGFTIPVLIAAVVAREASIWFGAWVGARGRRMKQRNVEAMAEYEEALAEVQAKQA